MTLFPKYTLFGLALIAGHGWMNYRGMGASVVREQKIVPTSIRQNPGSYRPAYGGVYTRPSYGGSGGSGGSFPTGK